MRLHLHTNRHAAASSAAHVHMHSDPQTPRAFLHILDMRSARYTTHDSRIGIPKLKNDQTLVTKSGNYIELPRNFSKKKIPEINS